MNLIGKHFKRPKKWCLLVSILSSHLTFSQFLPSEPALDEFQENIQEQDILEDNAINPEVEFNIGRGRSQQEAKIISEFKTLDPEAIRKKGLDKLDYMRELRNFDRLKISPKSRFKWSLENIKELEDQRVHKAILRKNSVLFSLDMEGAFTVKRDVYVNVIHGRDKRGFAYILNEKQIIVLKTNFKNLINIKEVTNLRVPPDKFEEIPVKNLEGPHIKRTTDKEVGYSYYQEATLSFVSRTGNYLDNILGSDRTDDIATANGYALGYQALFDFRMPVLFGGFAQADFLSATGANNEFSQTELSVGPLINIKIGTLFKRNFFTTLGASFSIYNKVTQTGLESRQVGLANQSFFLGLKGYIPFKKANLIASIRYQIDNTNPSAGDLSPTGIDETAIDRKLVFMTGITW